MDSATNFIYPVLDEGLPISFSSSNQAQDNLRVRSTVCFSWGIVGCKLSEIEAMNLDSKGLKAALGMVLSAPVVVPLLF